MLTDIKLYFTSPIVPWWVKAYCGFTVGLVLNNIMHLFPLNRYFDLFVVLWTGAVFVWAMRGISKARRHHDR